MNKKSKFFVCAICFVAFLCGAVASTVLKAQGLSPTAPAQPVFSFSKNLKLGDNNQDVKQLQIFLNGDFETRVSASGVGSKGQESTYFGVMTAKAVSRFQLKYKKEILDPYNIHTPTGFVGTATRAKMNSLVYSSVVSVPAPVVSTVSASSFGFVAPLPFIKARLPRLYTINPQQAKKGDVVVLVGAGFQINNTVHVGAEVFKNVVSQSDGSIKFILPSNISEGKQEVWVENSNGTSKVSGQPVTLVVSSNPKPAPAIYSVLPENISGYDAVAVTGAGFTSTGNNIISGFGEIKNISSDGLKITFVPKNLISAESLSHLVPGDTIKIDFYITNSNGVSGTLGSFNLKI